MLNQIEQPRVSVLMTVKNTEKFVDQTIRSVLDQTFSDFEFIILDDGSTDTTTQIIEKYSAEDTRIKSFYLKSSIGIPSGYNYVINQAMGEYFAIIDGDDFWEPTKLAKQVALLDSKADIAATSTFATVVDNHGVPLNNQESQGRLEHFNITNRSHSEWLRTFVLEGARSAHPSMMVRKSIVEEVGNYNPLLWQITDYDFWLRILAKYPIEIIEEPLLNYRWFPDDGGNVSSYSEAVMHRTMYESNLVFKDYFDNISNDLFYQAFREEIEKDFLFSSYTEDEKRIIKYYILRTIQSVSWSQDAIHLIALNHLGYAIKNDQVSERLLKQLNLTPIGFTNYDAVPIFYNSSDITPTLALQNQLNGLQEHVAVLLKLKESYESEIDYFEKTIEENQRLINSYKKQVEHYELQLSEKDEMALELEEYHVRPVRQIIKRKLKKQ